MHILLVDDHTLFREGLLHVLKQLDAEVLVYETATVEQAVQRLTLTRNLDLILLDIDLPGMDGLTALPSLQKLAPTVPIVVLSGSETPRHIQQALDNGAFGYIPKSHSSHQMREALSFVMRGDIYVPINLLDKPPTSPSALTARQMEVLKLMAAGLPNKSIAKTLQMAEATVKTHIAAILLALATHNRTQAVAEATRRGLLPVPNQDR
jgi:two-component system, NarL family, nitrate/nitrite response regulator NarL